MMSTFPYYGGRFNQLHKIMEALSEHNESFYLVVDVFGGFGKCLMIIPEELRKMKVYDDIHKDHFTKFRHLIPPSPFSPSPALILFSHLSQSVPT